MQLVDYLNAAARTDLPTADYRRLPNLEATEEDGSVAKEDYASILVMINTVASEADRLKRQVFYTKEREESDVRTDVYPLRRMHAVLGIISELGEVITAQPTAPDYHVNMLEECGDLMWYIALLINAVYVDAAAKGIYVNREAVLEANIAKLLDRFPEKFSSDKALIRDLGVEGKTLDQLLRIEQK